ncbi:hypothetical protein J4E93_008233 [Alternaria ventricosa]|uniref:uncharacterized protein n=1 Tax=Alternaria ventricosa TaxID=1187951 RepID=UPI0020C361D1|nr:uncharacterized protein J4E93_008233 [Alternaria ventricosa]KAI4640643.1 hypothetical protein J4E93_008233 [Alternaria ventricosa]
MVTNLPNAPAEPTGITALLFAESRARKAEYKNIMRGRQNCTVAATLAAIAKEDNRPERSKKRRRIRSAAAAYYPELPASETDSEPDNSGEELEVPTLQEDSAILRQALPTRSAGKRQASAEHALSNRTKRQSRRSRDGECPFASDAEPEFSVPANASSGYRARKYPMAILLPIQDGRNVVIRNGIPAQLTTLLRDEVNKWLTDDFSIAIWNDADHGGNYVCMLTASEGFVGSHHLPKDHGAFRACRTCSTSIEDGGLAAPRPCIMLRADAKGEYILFLPLPDDLRMGKGWKERGFWVNETPRAPPPLLDVLRARGSRNVRLKRGSIIGLPTGGSDIG